MGSFVRSVREAKVASPTTPKWSEAAWQRAFDAAAPHDIQDDSLFAAGIWFAQRLASLRSLTPELGTFGLQPEELVRAAIAGVNRNWLIAKEQLLLSMEPKPGELVVSAHLLSQRLKLEPWGIEVDPGALFEAAVDCMRHIAFVTAKPAAKRASVGDILDALLRRSLVSNSYFVFEELWKDCLWNSWAVFAAPDRDIVRPTEARQALAEAAASFRKRSLGFELQDHIARSWKKLPVRVRAASPQYRIVREIKGNGQDRKIVTRTRRDDEAPGSARLQMEGNGPWLDHLLHKGLPELPQLTPDLLFQAWDYLGTLAEASTKNMPEDTSVLDLMKLWSYARRSRFPL